MTESWRASRGPAFVAARREYDKKYAQDNRERINARKRERYASDPEHRARVRAKANSFDRSAYHEQYRQAHREQTRTRVREWRHGLAPGQFEQMLSAQGGKCLLCGIESGAAPRKQLVVDHCHATGRVRGLLCHTCNTELGVIEKRRSDVRQWLEYADRSDADDQLAACQAVVAEDRR